MYSCSILLTLIVIWWKRIWERDYQILISKKQKKNAHYAALSRATTLPVVMPFCLSRLSRMMAECTYIIIIISSIVFLCIRCTLSVPMHFVYNFKSCVRLHQCAKKHQVFPLILVSIGYDVMALL